MVDYSERGLARIFGWIGAGLLAVGGLVSIALAGIDAAIGHGLGALGYLSAGILLLVVGGLAGLFTWLGATEFRARPVTAGVLLLTIAFVGWAVVGFGPELLGIVGALLVFLAGVLYLIGPATHVASRVFAST